MPYYLNPFSGELDFTSDISHGHILEEIVTDAGTVVPVGNSIDLVGDIVQGIHTSGIGNIATISAYDASEVQKGVTELATIAETIGGIDSTRSIVSTGLKAKLGAQTNRALPYGTGDSTALGWTNPLTNGQIVIGSTLGAPTAGSITSTDGSVVITPGSGTIDLSALPTNMHQKQIIYVGKHGNDANDGLNIETAKLTFTSALLAANTTPISDIVCLDGGTYTENLTFNFYVNIFAPKAHLVGHHSFSGTGDWTFYYIQVPTGGTGFTVNTVGIASLYISSLYCQGTAIGFDLRGPSSINLYIGETTVENGTLFLFSSATNTWSFVLNKVEITSGTMVDCSSVCEIDISANTIWGPIAATLLKCSSVAATIDFNINSLGIGILSNIAALPVVKLMANSLDGALQELGAGKIDTISGSTKIENVPIGAVAASTGRFTTLSATLTSHGILMGNGTSGALQATAEPSNGQILIGKAGDFPQLGTLTDGNGISITEGAGSITIANVFSSTTENKVGTEASKSVSPSTLVGYTSDMVMTGILSWSGAGNYFDDSTLGTFKLLRGGTGYIKGKLVTWAAQDYVGMVAGNTYFIYIDSTGTIGASTSHLDSDYENYIMLFECLRDSTPVTNNQLTVREDHPYSFQTGPSNYLHDVVGPVIENVVNGANIAINGTQGIQINGTDYLQDHGLRTTISDSAGAAVTFVRMYTTAAGKWARQNATTDFTGYWNNAGTATALTAGRYGVYTLYVSKDNLNSSTPVYIAVLNNAQYTSQSSAQTAITNGSTSKASGEIAALEIAQLGYIIYRQSIASIVQVIISKSTLRATLSTSGTNQASLINTDTTNFNGWLSAADTNVQAALETLDNILGKDGVQVNTSVGNTTGTTSFNISTGTGGSTVTTTNGVFTVETGTGAVNLGTDAVAKTVTLGNTTGASALALKTGTGDFALTSATGTIISALDTGEITYPLQSSFSAYLSSTVTDKTGAGASYKLGNDALTEIFDRNSDFNVNGTFTAPVTGVYFLAASYQDSGNNANVYLHNLRLVTSNRAYTSGDQTPTGGNNGGSTGSFICDMDAGDTAYADAIVFGSSVGNTTDIYGDASFATGFQGFLLG